MALKSNKSGLALRTQTAPGIFNAPTAADLMPVSNMSLGIDGVTIANDEYTGTIHKVGDEIVGRNVTLSFDVNLRGPGGAAAPAAGAFLLGRLLTAAKFTELRQAESIPPGGYEVLGTGSTSTAAVLGFSAPDTPALFKAMLLSLSSIGTGTKSMVGIRSYEAGRVARLMNDLGTPPTNSYQVPSQLTYVRSIDETDPLPLSHYVWLDGVRYGLIDAMLSSLRFTVPTSTRDQAAIPKVSVALSAQLLSKDDEATPPIPTLGATPKFKDGKLYVANRAVGGSSVDVDFGLRTAAAPNPNKVDGSDAQELIESKTTVSLALQAYRKAQFDTLALADAQAQHSLFALWGYISGNTVALMVPDARFNFRSPDLGSEWVTESGDLMVDVFDRNCSLAFPYF